MKTPSKKARHREIYGPDGKSKIFEMKGLQIMLDECNQFLIITFTLNWQETISVINWMFLASSLIESNVAHTIFWEINHFNQVFHIF